MTDRHDDRPHLRAVPNNPPPTADHELEAAVLSALLNYDDPTTCTHIIDTLKPQDFDLYSYELIFAAIIAVHAETGIVETSAIYYNLDRHGDLPAVTGDYLHDIHRRTTPPVIAAQYLELLHEYTLRRLASTGITRLNHVITNAPSATLATDFTGAIDTIHKDFDTYTGRLGTTSTNTPIDDFLNTETAPYDWLVPGLFERGDRLIVTANEGMGKSTFCRQLAVQLAAGLHPFQHTWGTPHRVLFIDLENSDRQTQRNLKPLRVKVPTLNSDDLRIICRIEGLDLNDPTDVAWLDNEITDARPDVLITGPIYKMGSGDPNSEEVAKPVAMTIDKLRAKHGISVILEAHPNKTGVGTANRSKEPFGWSGWLRWPEFGIHIGDEGAITHWRGMREQRDFPTTLKRGGPWPWTPADTPEDLDWYKIRDTMKAVGKHLSVRDIERMTGITKSKAARILQDYSTQHTALMAQLNLVPTDDPDDDEA